MRPAELGGAMRIPVEHVDLRTIRKHLTYTYRPMGADKPVKVKGYHLDGDFVCVPRQYGLRICSQLQIPWDDCTTEGAPAKFPKVPVPREYQEQPLGEIREAFKEYYDVVFRAHTGWGKTIGSLITAASYGRATLIIVDQDNLKDQWLKVLTNPALFGFRREEIGEVQGDKCTYKGKAVTIAMVQTLTQRDYPEEFYNEFGFMIGDEIHTIGAPTFSKVLLQFPAMYRMGVSATPRRRDGLQKALDYNLGKVRVAADKQHEESSVYVVRNDTVYSWYGNMSPKVGRIITEVMEDGQRNLKIAEAALWLYESGRDTLILSDRIEHLKNIQCLLYYLGVPWEEIGLYTGYDPVWSFSKDPEPSGTPKGLHKWKNDDGTMSFAEYSAVSMQVKDKRVPKARLAEIEQNCPIILATYGKFAKGIDVPRLAGGVDATPRSQAEQVQGRILRELAGKLKPIWITIVDRLNYRLMYSFYQRIAEYVKSNSRLYEWDGQEETEEWCSTELRDLVLAEHKRLKRMEIVPTKDGGHRLAKAGTVQRQKAEEIRDKFKNLPQKRGGESRPGAVRRRSTPRTLSTR